MNDEIIYLLNKYLNNQCSSQELDRVMELLKQGKYQAEWALVLAEASDKALQGDLQADMSPEEISAWHERIKQTLQERSAVALPKRKIYWTRFAAAAMILFALSFGTYYFITNYIGSNQQPLTNNDIAPGGNKAYLTLADGRKLTLDSAAIGQLAEESNIKITKTADGQIVYEVQSIKTITPESGQASQSEADPNDNLKLTTYNTIETPKGGQYQVVLSDGTKVWLNADSRLTYPSRFDGDDRQVKIAGEAYFEVAHVKNKPFKVESNRQVIEVLGTHFNVSSYEEDKATKTTLLEGSVQVTSTSGQSANQQINQSTLLRPGQQSLLSDKKMHVTSDIDLEEITAWKNGYFKFSESLESIMAKVARWYDVEVVYQDDFGGELKFYGKVSRSKNLSAILEIIESTENVRFQVKGRRVIVMK